jgi:hypothetical protein
MRPVLGSLLLLAACGGAPDAIAPAGCPARAAPLDLGVDPVGKAVPRFSWTTGRTPDGRDVHVDLADWDTCNDDPTDDRLLFVVVQAPWCGSSGHLSVELARHADELRDLGVEVLLVGAEDFDGLHPSTGAAWQAERTVVERAGLASIAGTVVGDGEAEPPEAAFDGQRALRGFPWTLVIRRRDMRVIAASGDEPLDLLEIARHHGSP